jgi:hypothetical protein
MSKEAGRWADMAFSPATYIEQAAEALSLNLPDTQGQ